MSANQLELWQTEWCPASHRGRQRLTELGPSFIARRVPVDPDVRTDLLATTGQRSIPVLVADGEVVSGEEAIRSFPAPAAGFVPMILRHLEVRMSR